MPRSIHLTWQPGNNGRTGRWRKKYKGKTYYFNAGKGKSDRLAYDAAFKEWEFTKLRVDASSPRKYQNEYESTIDTWEQVLAWSTRHNEIGMAQIAYEKFNKLKGKLESPKLKPVLAEDRFESLFKPATIDLPDDLIEQAAKALSNGEVKFNRVPELTPENMARMSSELDGSPLRIQKEIWEDRLSKQHQRTMVPDKSLEHHIEEYVAFKEQESRSGKLTESRVYSVNLHLKHFKDWVGKDTPILDLDSAMLRGYHSQLLNHIGGEGGWSSTTARHYMVTVKAFVRWLWQVEAIPSLPRIVDGKSQVLNIQAATPAVVTFENSELQLLLEMATDRMKLYILLMLNCGMTQKDISDLKKSEVDLLDGRVIRKRSKTSGFENVPTVNYPLWPETHQLLKKYANNDKGEESILLNTLGSQLCTATYEKNGKYKKSDNIKNAFDRLRAKVGITKSLKHLKKTSATKLRNDVRYSGLEDLFLGHAPEKMSDKHYASAPQELFDSAIGWLKCEYKIGGK